MLAASEQYCQDNRAVVTITDSSQASDEAAVTREKQRYREVRVKQGTAGREIE